MKMWRVCDSPFLFATFWSLLLLTAELKNEWHQKYILKQAILAKQV